MLALGTKAPDFNLPDTISGKQFSLHDVAKENGLVIYFICNHCPYVKHVNKTLVAIAQSYFRKGIGFVAISSNDVIKYTDDRPELMKQTAIQEGYPFPYLYDETQDVARSYDAACTPDIYFFDGDLKLVYRGQLDDSRPGNSRPSDGADLKAAIDAILQGQTPNALQRPSAGCNIKWKS